MSAPTFLELARSIDRKLSGNVNWPLRVLSALAEAILDTDVYLTIDASLNNVTATLPSAATVKAGMPFWLMRTDSVLTNTVTIATTGGETINGGPSATIGLQYSSLQIVSNGTNWLLFSSPAAFSVANDVLWVFPGTLATDQNDNLYKLEAARAMSFVAFDCQLVTGPVGSDLIVSWLLNGGIVATVTVADGDTYAQTVAAVSLAPGDTLQMTVTQVGATTPGMTLVGRARGQ
jgi:hypothetical protein